MLEDTRKQHLINAVVFRSHCRELVKTTTKTDRLRSLKSLDHKLRTKPRVFGNIYFLIKGMIIPSLNPELLNI